MKTLKEQQEERERTKQFLNKLSLILFNKYLEELNKEEKKKILNYIKEND